MIDTLGGAGVHIMGSRTYRDMAAFWPSSSLPLAAPMNAAPKVIFSRRLGDGADHASAALEDAQARNAHRHGVTPSAEVLQSWLAPAVAGGALADEIGRLKAQFGNFILAHGGAAFARSSGVARLCSAIWPARWICNWSAQRRLHRVRSGWCIGRRL